MPAYSVMPKSLMISSDKLFMISTCRDIPTVAPAGQFRIAFLVIAAISLVGVWDSLKLSSRAGEHIT